MSQLLHAETKAEQGKLAAYCRDGKEPKIQGVTPNRLHHYRRLVYNVALEALSSTYPLTVNLLTEKEWSTLCHDFFEQHPCQDPQVWRMPFELIDYTETHAPELVQKYPLLLELLVFEWKEVEYYMMPDQSFPSASGTDPWNDTWALNPEAEIITLEYPLHMKNARFISPTDKGQYFCLIFRQPETFKVKFLNLSPFFAWMLASMMAEPASLSDLFPVIQSQFKLNDEQVLLQNVRPFYQKLLEDGMLVVRS